MVVRTWSMQLAGHVSCMHLALCLLCVDPGSDLMDEACAPYMRCNSMAAALAVFCDHVGVYVGVCAGGC